jgi:8-oxo-dGTP diphosphatase
MPGVWEFPGGKCEADESPEAATVRECGEELGIPVVLRGLRRTTTHRYHHGLVELYYFDCTTEDPRAEPDASSGFRWVAAGDLPALEFPEANEPVLRELADASARSRRG